MKLTKSCKHVLETVNQLQPDLNSIFYTVDYVISHTILSRDQFLGVLNTLNQAGAIRWGDQYHSAFALNETGREYKQLDRLEAKARWLERLFGFVSGGIVATIPWLLTL